MLLGIAVLLCLLVSAGWVAVRPHPAASWALIASSAAWLPANQPLEGAVLFAVARTHGVTVADLAALAGLGLGTAGLLGGARLRGADRERLAVLAAAAASVFAAGALVAFLRP